MPLSPAPSPPPRSSVSPPPRPHTLTPPSGNDSGIVFLSPRTSATLDPPAPFALVAEVDPLLSPPEPAQPGRPATPAAMSADGAANSSTEQAQELPDDLVYSADGVVHPAPPADDSAELDFGTFLRDSSPFHPADYPVGEIPVPSPPQPDAEGEEEAADALFTSSVLAGEESRDRRLRRSRAPERLENRSWDGLADQEEEREERGVLDLFFPPPPGLGGEEREAVDELEADTGWVYIPSVQAGAAGGAAGEGGDGEISPEEERARRMGFFPSAASPARTASPPPYWRFGTEALDVPPRSRGWLGRRQFEEANQQDLADEWEEQEERRGEGSGFWRNDPLPVPRTSALPRGGRALTGALQDSIGRRTPTSSASNSTFSPANPLLGSSASSSTPNVPLFRARILADSANPGLSLDDASPGTDDPPSRALRTNGESSAAADDVQFLWQMGFSSARSSSIPSPEQPPRTANRSIFSPPPRNAPTPQFRVLPSPRQSTLPAAPASPQRRRTREETNAMVGHALRGKKRVWVVYCGGEEGLEEQDEEGGERLPSGFEYVGGSDGESGSGARSRARGCGALLSARVLVDGVPPRVFSDADARAGKERPAVASDLPPSVGRVGDLEGDGEGGQRVGRRGWKGCKGCVTRDLGCKRCGARVGYRLLRPCVTCSICRPAYTSYANAVSSNPSASSSFIHPFSASSSNPDPHAPPRLFASSLYAGGGLEEQEATRNRDRGYDPPASNQPGGASSSSSSPQALTLSAGGVTGGGIVDGLLFYFAREAVTPVPRRVGIAPAEELSAAQAAEEGWKALDEEREAEEREKEEREREAERMGGKKRGRIGEKRPERGEGMRWKHIPSPQADFNADLLGEPSEWITPGSETWWLENAVAKHTQKHHLVGEGSSGVGRKRTASGAFEGEVHATDRLSSASTTVNSATGASSLHRSGAIRHRIPLASSSTSSSPSASDEYDRYRLSASDFQRRVRQRLADPSAAGTDGTGEVLRGLERAGYGSGFGEAVEEVRERESASGFGLRRRSVAGRRRESVGR
ncbi:hypothetical protein JCM8097_002783 [Rhodosporidiobolus ruineniae]